MGSSIVTSQEVQSWKAWPFHGTKLEIPGPFWQVQLQSPCSRKASLGRGVIQKPCQTFTARHQDLPSKIPICEEEHLVHLIGLQNHQDHTAICGFGSWSMLKLSVSSQHPGRRGCRLWKSWSLTTPKVSKRCFLDKFWVVWCFLQLAVVLPDLVTKLPSKGRTLLQHCGHFVGVLCFTKCHLIILTFWKKILEKEGTKARIEI